jgi:FkbM family methyltransferase
VRVPVKGVGKVTLRRDSTDALVFSQVFTGAHYELARFPQYTAVQSRYRRILASGRQPLIIDAGANNGASALWFATRFPKAKVVAVEPEPINASLCQQNTRGFDVEVLQMAIGSKPGSVSLLADDRESWAVSTIRSSGGNVPICTVGEIVAARPGCALFVMKIDIEGFESDLFASDTDWVADTKVIFVEPHDWMLPDQGSSRNFQKVMSSYDFDIFISGENLAYIRR